MGDENIKTSIIIPKELIDKMEGEEQYTVIGNRSMYINQVLRKHFGMKNVFEMSGIKK